MRWVWWCGVVSRSVSDTGPLESVYQVLGNEDIPEQALCPRGRPACAWFQTFGILDVLLFYGLPKEVELDVELDVSASLGVCKILWDALFSSSLNSNSAVRP